MKAGHFQDLMLLPVVMSSGGVILNMKYFWCIKSINAFTKLLYNVNKVNKSLFTVYTVPSKTLWYQLRYQWRRNELVDLGYLWQFLVNRPETDNCLWGQIQVTDIFCSFGTVFYKNIVYCHLKLGAFHMNIQISDLISHI